MTHLRLFGTILYLKYIYMYDTFDTAQFAPLLLSPGVDHVLSCLPNQCKCTNATEFLFRARVQTSRDVCDAVRSFLLWTSPSQGHQGRRADQEV